MMMNGTTLNMDNVTAVGNALAIQIIQFLNQTIANSTCSSSSLGMVITVLLLDIHITVIIVSINYLINFILAPKLQTLPTIRTFVSQTFPTIGSAFLPSTSLYRHSLLDVTNKSKVSARTFVVILSLIIVSNLLSTMSIF